MERHLLGRHTFFDDLLDFKRFIDIRAVEIASLAREIACKQGQRPILTYFAQPWRRAGVIEVKEIDVGDCNGVATEESNVIVRANESVQGASGVEHAKSWWVVLVERGWFERKQVRQFIQVDLAILVEIIPVEADVGAHSTLDTSGRQFQIDHGTDRRFETQAKLIDIGTGRNVGQIAEVEAVDKVSGLRNTACVKADRELSKGIDVRVKGCEEWRQGNGDRSESHLKRYV